MHWLVDRCVKIDSVIDCFYLYIIVCYWYYYYTRLCGCLWFIVVTCTATTCCLLYPMHNIQYCVDVWCIIYATYCCMAVYRLSLLHVLVLIVLLESCICGAIYQTDLCIATVTLYLIQYYTLWNWGNLLCLRVTLPAVYAFYGFEGWYATWLWRYALPILKIYSIQQVVMFRNNNVKPITCTS